MLPGSPHIMLAGATSSGKITTLKVLLVQYVQHSTVVIIDDFKGGVDFGKWFQDYLIWRGCKRCLKA